MAKEDKLFQKKKRKLGDNAESLESPASKEQLLEIYKIKDLGQLKAIMTDNDFIN